MSKKKYDNSWWSDKEKEQGYAFRKVKGRLVRFTENGPEDYASSKYGDKAYSKTDTQKRVAIKNRNKARNKAGNINNSPAVKNDKIQSKNASISRKYDIQTDIGDTISISPIKNEIGPGFTAKYNGGIEKGMTFGLRMLGTHNTDVYGKVIDVTDESIKVQHPRGSIYEVPLNDVKVNGRELRFYNTDDKKNSWFGFKDLNKFYGNMEDIENFAKDKSVEDTINRSPKLKNAIDEQRLKTEKEARETIKDFIKDKARYTEHGINTENDLYKELNEYINIDKDTFDKITKEENELQNSIYKPKNQTIEFVDSEDRFGKDGKPLDVSLNKYIENGKLSPEREKLHQDIINSYFDADKYPVKEGERLYYMTGGGAGTGKSTFVGDTEKYYGKDFEIYKADKEKDIKLFKGNMIKLDADEIKKKLGLDPKNPDSAGYLHGESSALVKRITAIAQERGYNVMLDGTGDGSEEGMLKKIDQAHKNGYKVIANYGTVSQEEGLKRNWGRYTGAIERGESPRLVSGKEVVKTHAMVSRILPNIASKFDSVKLYDMTNKPPVLIAEGGNGLDLKVKTGYNTKYQEFLKKGNYNWEDYKNYYEKMLDDLKKERSGK